MSLHFMLDPVQPWEFENGLFAIDLCTNMTVSLRDWKPSIATSCVLDRNTERFGKKRYKQILTIPLADSVNCESLSGPYIHQACGLPRSYKRHWSTKQYASVQTAISPPRSWADSCGFNWGKHWWDKRWNGMGWDEMEWGGKGGDEMEWDEVEWIRWD